MAQPGQGEQHRGEGAVATRVEALEHHPEVQQRQAERDRERELPRQRGRDVPAVDREAPVEEERQRRHREHGGRREAGARHAPERVGADGQGHHAEDRDQLERHAVRQPDQGERHDGPGQREVAAPALRPERRRRPERHDARHGGDERRGAVQAGVQQHDEQRRQHHVELVRGEAGIPGPGPPGDLPVRQQVVTQEGRTPHVGAHVAAGGGGVAQQQVRLQVPHHEPDAGGDDDHVDDRLERAPLLLDPGDGEVVVGQLGPCHVPRLGQGVGGTRLGVVGRGVEVGGGARHGQSVTIRITVTMLNAMWAKMAGARRPVRWVT